MIEYVKSSVEVLGIARDAGKMILTELLVATHNKITQAQEWVERQNDEV